MTFQYASQQVVSVLILLRADPNADLARREQRT